MSKCYRFGGCGPYEYLSCSDCPASKLEYLERLAPSTTEKLTLDDINTSHIGRQVKFCVGGENGPPVFGTLIDVNERTIILSCKLTAEDSATLNGRCVISRQPDKGGIFTLSIEATT